MIVCSRLTICRMIMKDLNHVSFLSLLSLVYILLHILFVSLYEYNNSNYNTCTNDNVSIYNYYSHCPSVVTYSLSFYGNVFLGLLGLHLWSPSKGQAPGTPLGNSPTPPNSLLLCLLCTPEKFLKHIYHYYLLLLSSKTETHFTIPRRTEG